MIISILFENPAPDKMKKLDNVPTETLSMNFFCNSCHYDSFSICIKSMYHAYKPKGNNWFFLRVKMEFFPSYNIPQCVIKGKW